MRVIYPSFDASKLFTIQAASLSRNIRYNDHWVIGTVGRLSEEKRHVDLLKAFAIVLRKFPKATLLIVGDGYLRSYLEDLSVKLNISDSVNFVGFQENVFRFLTNIDVFVLPSRTEGAGISILEAMAVGLPIVATKVGGIPEVVTDNITGLLVNPYDISNLAKAISKLLSKPELIISMGENGREKVFREFDPKRFVDQHEHIYKSLISEKVFSL